MKTRYIDMTQIMHVNGKFTDIYSYIKNILFLTVLLTVGATSAWAQTFEPGLYFIASRDYAPANTTTNFYLCPTEGWYYYQSSDPYYTNSDNGMPFMTTYQCRNGEYDALNAIWSIEKVGETNYYYIKHVNDGKYLTYNRKMASGNEGRMRMHLEASPSDNDAAQFQINWNDGTSCYEITTKKENNRKYLNPTGPSSGNGNINSLVGTNARSDGPSGLAVGGIIGLWTGGPASDNNSKWYLEDASSYVCETPTITYNESTHEVSMSTATGGAKIYYTTDGTEPTTSSTAYTTPFTVSNTTTIQAIAVKAGMVNSLVASKKVVKYTYIIVNRANNIAIQHTIPYPVSEGTPLSGYASIPEEIKSPYISDEDITFKSFEGDFSEAALEAADEIHATPTTENIYITYTTNNLPNRFLHLQGVRTFNVKNSSSQFVYDDGTDTSVDYDSSVDATKADKKYVWYFSGSDPYAITVQSVNSKKYLTYTSTPSPTLGLADSPQTYIIKGASPLDFDAEHEDATGTITLQSTDGSVVFTVTPVKLPLSYTLIDKAGKKIADNIEYTGSWGLPAEWQSPLATYKYYKAATIVGDTYSFSEDDRIGGIEETDDNVVYVTYDVKKDIDIQGGKTYLMKFSDGTFFKQENGSDGVNTNATKAIYPYNNGDFNLYVYGLNEDATDKFEQQLSNGASTRTRWLWYLVSNHNGTDLTGDNIDPYHIIVKSRQNQSYKVGDNSYDGNSYMYTYKPNDDVGVITGVITQHDVVKTLDPTLKPTEYMLLGTDVNHMVLKTVNEVDGARQTVNKFEQYWKNNPTARDILNKAGKGVGSQPVTYELSNEQKAELTDLETGALQWHTYESWAYAAPWNDSSTGGKTLTKGNHWFQTISMGSGEFSVQEVTLEPEVILLDQHGWEIARIPMSQKATLKKYDSPMVQQYHWYPSSSASKVSGYHKYTVNSQEITVYDADGKAKTVEPLTYIHNSNSLADIPYDHAPINDQIAKVKTDFYVTYTVKSDYAGAYQGAATEGSVKASSYFLKQAGKYAQNSSNTIALVDQPSLTGVIPTDVQWKVKPNFNIDHEMGYKYSGETGALPEAESKIDIETAYNEAGKNGFDPYNVQIQSVSNTARYFTADTKSSTIERGIWKGTGSTKVSLREMSVGHTTATGYDQTTLDITNATFMIVDDGNGNMCLMPRFDNTKVMTSFTGLSEQLPAAAAGNNGEGTQSLVLELVPIIVSSTDDILSMKGYYILTPDFNLKASIGTSSTPFEGTIDGQLNEYSFDKPLVLYANNATIRNVILEGVTIASGSTAGNVGAICCEATGNTRIYNCGINHSSTVNSTVSGSNYVGGIVGLLAGYSRVINCYSYANITGGTNVGGIVGYNNYASTAANLRTMVMNCMFYGDITGCTTVSPVYGGYNIANLHGGLNTFNYYAYQQLPTEHITGQYNSALSIDDKYLNRFEFYRQLLNSNKRLAAYYATGSASNANQMAKWVLETADRSIAEPDTPKPYPVLKAQAYYPSIINYDLENAPDSASVGRNKGGKLGKTLTVHLSGTGITTTELTIDRTDKDFDRFNFNYDKIQLPYFNDVGTGNYTDNQVVTGWEITSMTGGTEGTYETGDKWNGYNFADRNCTNKDLVGKSGRIFSQGAYFDVPYGVTDIFIQPHWATAAYVADEYLDVVYNTDYKAQSVTQLEKQFPDGKVTINGSEQVVYKTISEALSGKSSSSVYDLAIVLVGNLHQSDVPSKETVPFTIMSVDEDNDHEPDYSMIYHHTGRTVICPIRFDFINIPGTCQAQKPNGVSKILNFTIFKTKGWFETTNTCLVYSNQVEYENRDGVGTKANAPLILLGGDFEQFVSTQKLTVTGRTTYIHVGGNVYIQSFGLGTHGDGKEATPHIPVSVTGGEYKGFYLTGTYNPNAAVSTDNAECYISGGHFVEAAGACQEKINGNVQWQIYDADIDEFFGGGINDASPITGSITTEIYNSHVGTFCGGPKFGNMTTGKAVTTTAVGCVFDEYFGAGYGGLSYSRLKYSDERTYNFNSTPYQTERGKYYNGVNSSTSYGKKGPGVATDFDYEFFVWSTGETGSRKYIKFASFSLAQCDNVSSTLTGCTVNGNYYGGGSLGKVVGTATSVLDNCTVKGNVFGGGFSAHIPKVAVRNAGTGLSKKPSYNSNTGMFEPGTFSGTTDYEWKHVDTLPGEGGAGFVTEGGKDYVITKADLTTLGQVAYTDLTVRNNCKIDGGVFGGGDESAVNQNTLVKIENVKTTEDPQNTILNVYGGGNTANVDGNTEVNMTSGTVSQDVYGGGRGETTKVGGNVLVNFGAKDGVGTLSGTGIVNGDVYGGSALGAVNTTPNASSVYDKTTTVNIYAGIVNGNAFGGGLGQLESGTLGDPGYEAPFVAKNYGATTINMEGGLVNTAVYGGANVNGVLKNKVYVNILGGTVNTEPASTPASDSDIKDVVFGGGYGEHTIVEGDIAITIGPMSPVRPTTPAILASPTVYGNLYGGSALGKVQVSEADANLLDNKIDVNLYGGTIYGNVFGGGLGRKAADAVGTPGSEGYKPAQSAVAAKVGGNVFVLLDGSKLNCIYAGEGDNRVPLTGQIFGANNLNGTPKGHVKVHVKRTADSAKPDETARDSRTTYDVAAVYGGGNQADYVPTDALIVLDPNDPEYATKKEKFEKAFAEVLIEGCDATSIEYVYGGGNAAAVPATDVTILGDYIINYVFGGGNGKSTPTFTNPGANIGTYNNGATEYGTGKAETKLVGGHIMYVFGGSDTKGNVRGGTSLSMPDQSTYPAPTYDCCDVRDVKEIYGAGNLAEQDGDVTLIMGCVSNMDYVYGGARNAHVKGGVDLVVTSGHFKGVFGGNNIAGTIQGPIKVTIEETGCDPLIIDSLYLGGNQAAYSVYGYKDVEGTLVARTSMTDGTAVNPPVDDAGSDDITEKQLYRDPVLNIVSCTSIGNAFGGGLGTGAVMYGSPTVNVNMIPGDYAKDIDRDGTPGADNDATALGEIGNVYGGGEEANVNGNTTVNIVTEETVTVRSHMGGPVATPSPTEVKGALITGNVFGAGKGKDAGNSGDVDLAFVTGNTTINMKGGEVKKSIYGGGELSQIGGDSHITVSGGTIGTTGQGGAVYGNVYGGGLGKITDVLFGLVKGNTNISIKDNASILHNIYGGGAYGSVGTYTFSNGETTCAKNTGTANITVTGGTIGTDGHENGMVFGSSRGDVTKPTGSPALDPNDHLAWVNATNVVVGTAGKGTTLTTPLIKGSVYGSGENGHTYHDTNVTIHSGTIGITDTDIDGGAAYAFRGNVYGGGCGTDMYDSNDDTVEDTYNPLSGIVKGNATVLIDGGHVVHNVYGAGAMGSVEGNTSVTITGDAHIGVDGSAHANGYVYAAAKGDEALDDAHQAYVGSTTLNISGGTVWGDAFGGGQSGIVKGAVRVNLTGGTLKQDVYGGGALAKTNTMYDGANETYRTYVTNVALAGATVMGNVYGGGLGRIAVGIPSDPGYVEAVAADVQGPDTVTVSNGKAANVFGCNNLNGAPQQTVAVTVNGTTVPVMPATFAIDNVYGGGNKAAYTGTPTVTMAGGYVNNIYGGGLGSTAIINGGTTVAINGGTVVNDVYGGGSQADVTGSVNVSVTGGTVTHDVYGGGALANTNTANWDSANNTWTDTSTGTYYAEVKHLTKDVSDVDGFYTRTGSEPSYSYVPASGKALENTKYYKKLDNFLNVAANGTTYNTTVSLTGGIIGNAYGGGLGQLTPTGESSGEGAVAAMVYGDVAVTVDGTKFTKETERVDGKAIATTGSVFGCNNKNGSPKGHVVVTVESTQPLEGGPHVKNQFEIQAVYGGGNMANYTPDATNYDIQTEFGCRSRVLIKGCDNTSIERVYGGGNASDIPFTDVTIEGSFQIGYVFGGGNGGDKIYKVNSWIENPGANVTNFTNVLLKGGTIGEAFGGSDSKGSVGGSDLRRESGECPLVVDNVYGASKEADTDGDVRLDLSGCGNGEIAFVFGGSYNANVRGNVTINISSGIYTSVYGGNDRQGNIGGNITINVEEVDECNPIIIQNLFGGGRRADYPGTGAKTWKGGDYPKGGPDLHPDSYNDFTSGNISINIKAATRIDRVYGGCDNAIANGNSTVNINMVKGSMAGHGFQLPAGYTGDPIPNIHSGDAYAVVYGIVAGETNVDSYYTRSGAEYTKATGKAAAGVTYYEYKTGIGIIDDAIGTIGDVFGGGNEGDVVGNVTVNIGTEEEIEFVKTPAHLTANSSGKHDVHGAYITGSVYGGGNISTIGRFNLETDEVISEGNTFVNVCAKEVESVWTAVPEGSEHVKIIGNVFGGGKGQANSFKCEKAMITGSTTVRIGNGTIDGTVYGGGEVGRVQGNTAVTIGLTPETGETSSPIVQGYVYGAGKGVNTHDYSALVRGNATVTIQSAAKIGKSVYGGGELASVGQYNIADEAYHSAHPEVAVGMPYSLVDNNKGICTVVVKDNAEIGPDNMTMPTFLGHVFGAGKGVLPYEGYAASENPRRMISGDTWEEYTDEADYLPYVETLALATQTNVTIGGNAFIKGSVYGGSENGYVQHNTQVTIQDDCQIGCGRATTERHPAAVWAADYTPSDAVNLECASWTYGQAAAASDKYLPYDPYADAYASFPEGERDDFISSTTGDDGHTYYGNVFGGGSGKEPYRAGKWHKEAGSVGGNTTVNITGGHILTSVYGGNEVTDVKGSCTVSMSGGTLGVPRTLEQIAAHPVTCYLFGAGKGDQRTHFNTWTNVASTTVTVSGGTIYGSVFGGGEDGHVLGNTTVNIRDAAKIGTWGTSYIDGNVFGGGRGFSGDALTAGTVGGNVDVNITGGQMLGSVYGGGRLASVGTFFTDPEDGRYGQLHEDADGKTYGHITIDISGGTIGKAGATGTGSEHSGNVFGASMGRLTLLDNSFNPLWPELAQAKTTAVNITGGTITRNVYGGGEFGTVREDASVTISGGTISGSVFGGGYGSDDHEHATPITVQWDGGTKHYVYTPMQWAGMVGGNTTVHVSGGQVSANVYGGGELASVGIIDYSVKPDAGGPFTIDGEKYAYNSIVKHADIANPGTAEEQVRGFGLSWPYQFKYVSNKSNSEEIGGKTTVNITGGRIGQTGVDHVQGYVFGGGKGKAMERYTEAFCANVRETAVTIDYATTPESDDGSNACVGAGVYGGAEDGHVYEDTKVEIKGGLIGFSVYGGGKGIGTYPGKLRDRSTGAWKGADEELPSWTAGKVYGNTCVVMTGGHVMRNVVGGGYFGSVGKGNYAGGTDDYFQAGYGETLIAGSAYGDGKLWTSATVGDGLSAAERDHAWHFLNSGKTSVTITDGTVGTATGTYDGYPTGQVYGGSRGTAAEDVGMLSPRYDYAPNFFIGYANESEVTIGDATHAPTIYGSVYGGGRDGHVRRSASVTVNNGTIGVAYESSGADRRDRGNVFGSGSGMGTWDDTHHGSSSGSVTRNTTVLINGGTIYNNVYGGGALSSVGPPLIGTDIPAGKDITLCKVTISGGTIGTAAGSAAGYGGSVYGASRGGGLVDGESLDSYATTIWNEVNILDGTIAGSVYGGGQAGRVKKDVEVNLKGGSIAHDAFGGGQGTRISGANMEGIAADVGGNVTVKLNEGVGNTSKGCSVRRVFGCNDMNGSPKGHVLVHVYATQHRNRPDVSTKYPKYDNIDNYTTTSYAGLTALATAVGANVSAYTDTLGDDSASDDEKETALANMREAISLKKYDVQAVYGGGNLAPYTPTDAYSDNEATRAAAFAEVIIDGCELTSIMEVYGNGNAAPTPASRMTVNGCHEIDELFGGGNGYDNYEIDGTWYENPGANVGYHNYTHYVKNGETGYDAATHGRGTPADPYKAIDNGDASNKEYRMANYAYGSGEARTEVFGGRIHNAYGGSNIKGNIRILAMSSYDSASECPSEIDHTYGGGNKALIDGEARLLVECVDYMDKVYGGNTNADVNNNIMLTITNGVYGTVIGGNDQGGNVSGSITVNIKESGCKPIIIDELYGGGYLADYSIYGYRNTEEKDDKGKYIYKPRTKEEFDAARTAALADVDESNQTAVNNALIAAGLYGFPKANPRINIISATKIGEVYGGGYKAVVIGSPTINVNMEEGMVTSKYAAGNDNYSEGKHTLHTSKGGVTRNDDYEVIGHVMTDGLTKGNAILKTGTINYIYGGGNMADVIGNTNIEIGTGSWFNPDTRLTETLERKSAFVLGNVYGGGRMGNVGNFTKNDAGHPISCVSGTGTARITISNGEIGPNNMKMYHEDVDPAKDSIDDAGHVYGGGKGTNHVADDDQAFCDSTEVIINGTAWVKGCVFGGGENGHVLHNAGVKIGGDSQIGEGYIKIKEGGINIDRGLNRRYTDEEWAEGHLMATTDDFSDATEREAVNAKFAHSLPECASWVYGEDTNGDDKNDTWAPYDIFAGTAGYDAKGGKKIASSGRTFYGSVFGGGSGFFPYEPGKWLDTAGQVEGDTWVEISGGHVLTSIYGGCEMSSMLGDAHVTMTGGTLGVPRTLAEIDAHPVTCYLFGGGKGDQRVYFNRSTDVRDAYVNVEGGTIYGSVFGGGEDGHVMRNAYVTIGKDDGTGPTIGTWGTSYVDGNIFGAGRGFGGDAYTAGNVAGSVKMNIKGGNILGSVYGGGRLGSVGYGLYTEDATGKYGTMRPDYTDTDAGSAYLDGSVSNFKRGYVDITISGGTIGNSYEFIVPDEGFESWDTLEWSIWRQNHFVPKTEYDTATGRLLHTKGGNVFAGGMGRREMLDGTTEITAIDWTKLGNVKQASLTITGDHNPWIMGNVYGGGEMGAVTTATASDATLQGGNTSITITGGTIGTEVTGTKPQPTTVDTPTDGTLSAVKYTFGSVYGGGMGTKNHGTSSTTHGGSVAGSTTVSISGSDTRIRASVYGGGEMATVYGNSNVGISDGKIGRDEVRPSSDKNPGYVMFGGATMGNVYGGGQGHVDHTEAGQVMGNTNVTISGGSVYHNVYGGGALASVGNFNISDGTTPAYIPFAGVPYDWTNGGTTNVTITGGTIGISGRDNGMVFGSSRGDIAEPTGTPVAFDPYDRVAWVKNSVVTIGADRSTEGPTIKGSVYGGGENGHNSGDATVTVNSGVLGVVDLDDAWYDLGNDSINAEALITRGNVYGAGCGTDTYTSSLDDRKLHNTKAGLVGGNTTVNIKGGHVGHSVYGAGSMASVGTIMSEEKHDNPGNDFALSWPYKFVFADNTGSATVNITGGHIGTRQQDGGDVYGSARGEAGDRYETADQAFVRESHVNVSYPETYAITDEASIQDNLSVPCITGSVHGSGENGYVYDDAHVTVSEGLIGHSVYGAGKGKGTYKQRLLKIGAAENSENDGDYYNAKIYSLIAGKVFGNTYVTMTGGHVMRNVYGGGNMGSVGKGNYASGTDDYAHDCEIGKTNGYGEVITTGLWDGVNANSQAFLGSGKTTVRVLGGKVGYIDTTNPENSMKNLLPYGNVFGGSAGEAAPNILNNPRYLYSPAFFSGYVNETDVTIGLTSEQFEANKDIEPYKTYGTYETYKTSGAPTILGSVYGGGQEGHVRRDTKVTVNSGKIGLPYTADNQSVLQTSDLDSPQWLYRGNVYGAGSGITHYSYDFNYDGDFDDENEQDYSNSAGSVTRFTEVDINGGTIHRNVYGGGSLASVGPPNMGQNYDPYQKGDTADGHGEGRQSQCTVNIAGTVGSPSGYNKVYGGEVYGASRGITELKEKEDFSFTIWTQVNIFNGANIKGNVYGGGDTGIVKKNTEVNVGATRP